MLSEDSQTASFDKKCGIYAVCLEVFSEYFGPQHLNFSGFRKKSRGHLYEAKSFIFDGLGYPSDIFFIPLKDNDFYAVLDQIISRRRPTGSVLMQIAVLFAGVAMKKLSSYKHWFGRRPSCRG